MSDYKEVVLITEYRDRDDEKKTRFTKLGMAFPYRDGDGYILKLQALPVPTMDDESGEIAYVIHIREPYDAEGGGRSSGRGRDSGDRRGGSRGGDRGGSRSSGRGRDDDRPRGGRDRDRGRERDKREDDLDDEIPF
jgi:uncharacterized membrane protein YgcG